VGKIPDGHVFHDHLALQRAEERTPSPRRSKLDVAGGGQFDEAAVEGAVVVGDDLGGGEDGRIEGRVSILASTTL